MNNAASSIGIAELDLPTIGTTIASPLQYGYRTKITPHFNAAPRGTKKLEGTTKPRWLRIGFNINDTQLPMDIEVNKSAETWATATNHLPRNVKSLLQP